MSLEDMQVEEGKSETELAKEYFKMLESLHDQVFDRVKQSFEKFKEGNLADAENFDFPHPFDASDLEEQFAEYFRNYGE